MKTVMSDQIVSSPTAETPKRETPAPKRAAIALGIALAATSLLAMALWVEPRGQRLTEVVSASTPTATPPAGEPRRGGPPAEDPATAPTANAPAANPKQPAPDAGALILKTIYDAGDREFYQQIRTDIEKHPLLAKHDLFVHIVKVENGYVRLTVLTGDTDLTHRLANQSQSVAEAVFTNFGQQYHALHRLAEAIAKNEACKGVFWEEIGWVRARRLFHEANVEFGDAIRATDKNWPAVLEHPTTAGVIGEALSPVAARPGNPPPRWLVSFEEALKEFPAQERAWSELKKKLRTAASDPEIDEVLRELQRFGTLTARAQVADRNYTVPFDHSRYWGTMAFCIRCSVTGMRARVQAIAKILTEPRQAVFSVRESGFGGRHFTVLAQRLYVGDLNKNGWVIEGVAPPLPQAPAELLGKRFRPVTVLWDIDRGFLSLSQFKGPPFDTLYREEDGEHPIVWRFSQVGRRSYQTKDGAVRLEVFPDGTDADLLRRIPFPARPAEDRASRRNRWVSACPEKMDREDLTSLLDGLKIAIGRPVKLRDGLTYWESLEGVGGTPQRRRVLASSETRLGWKWEIAANTDSGFVRAATDLLRAHQMEPSGQFHFFLPAELEERLADLEWKHLVTAHAILDLTRIQRTVFAFTKTEGDRWDISVERMDIKKN